MGTGASALVTSSRLSTTNSNLGQQIANLTQPGKKKLFSYGPGKELGAPSSQSRLDKIVGSIARSKNSVSGHIQHANDREPKTNAVAVRDINNGPGNHKTRSFSPSCLTVDTTAVSTNSLSDDDDKTIRTDSFLQPIDGQNDNVRGNTSSHRSDLFAQSISSNSRPLKLHSPRVMNAAKASATTSAVKRIESQDELQQSLLGLNDRNMDYSSSQNNSGHNITMPSSDVVLHRINSANKGKELLAKALATEKQHQRSISDVSKIEDNDNSMSKSSLGGGNVDIDGASINVGKSGVDLPPGAPSVITQLLQDIQPSEIEVAGSDVTKADTPERYHSKFGLPCANLDYVVSRYHLHEKLGEGSFGKVYKGFDDSLERTVAIKICTLHKSAQRNRKEQEQELLNEVHILQMSTSPYVIQYLDAHLCSQRRKNDRFWIIMEYCDRGSLLDLINNAWEKDGYMGSLSETTIKLIASFILLGLEFLHRKNIIHRDLKGGNVLLTSDGRVKIADFGVSRQLTSSAGLAQTMVGTPSFAAPEVLRSGTSESLYDVKVDVWSFGILLIQMCQTRMPFKFRTPYMAMIRIPHMAPPTLKHQDSRTKEMNDFIAVCLTKDPKRRPSATELLDRPFLKNEVQNLEPQRMRQLRRQRRAQKHDVSDVCKKLSNSSGKDQNHFTIEDINMLVEAVDEEDSNGHSTSIDSISPAMKTPKYTSIDRSSAASVATLSTDDDLMYDDYNDERKEQHRGCPHLALTFLQYNVNGAMNHEIASRAYLDNASSENGPSCATSSLLSSITGGNGGTFDGEDDMYQDSADIAKAKQSKQGNQTNLVEICSSNLQGENTTFSSVSTTISSELSFDRHQDPMENEAAGTFVVVKKRKEGSFAKPNEPIQSISDDMSSKASVLPDNTDNVDNYLTRSKSRAKLRVMRQSINDIKDGKNTYSTSTGCIGKKKLFQTANVPNSSTGANSMHPQRKDDKTLPSLIGKTAIISADNSSASAHKKVLSSGKAYLSLKPIESNVSSHNTHKHLFFKEESMRTNSKWTRCQDNHLRSRQSSVHKVAIDMHKRRIVQAHNPNGPIENLRQDLEYRLSNFDLSKSEEEKSADDVEIISNVSGNRWKKLEPLRKDESNMNNQDMHDKKSNGQGQANIKSNARMSIGTQEPSNGESRDRRQNVADSPVVIDYPESKKGAVSLSHINNSKKKMKTRRLKRNPKVPMRRPRSETKYYSPLDRAPRVFTSKCKSRRSLEKGVKKASIDSSHNANSSTGKMNSQSRKLKDIDFEDHSHDMPENPASLIPRLKGDRRRLSNATAQLDSIRAQESKIYSAQRFLHGFTLQRLRGRPGASNITQTLEVISTADEFTSYMPEGLSLGDDAICYFEVLVLSVTRRKTANVHVGVVFEGFRTGSHEEDVGNGALDDSRATFISGLNPLHGRTDAKSINEHQQRLKNAYKAGSTNPPQVTQSYRACMQCRIGWQEQNIIGIAIHRPTSMMHVSVNGEKWQSFALNQPMKQVTKAEIDVNDSENISKKVQDADSAAVSDVSSRWLRCCPCVCVAGTVVVQTNFGQVPFLFEPPTDEYQAFLGAADDVSIFFKATDHVAARIERWKSEDIQFAT